MEVFVQFVIHWPGHGWVLLAIFRDVEPCQAVAELVVQAWALDARCVRDAGA